MPAQGAAVPEEVDLDPDVVQATPVEDTGELPAPKLTITEILAGSEDFTTLTSALRATGLTDTLKAAGTYTLLAPNNAAFSALPPGVLTALMMPENLPTLKAILSYHLLPQSLKSSALLPGDFATSQGESITIVGGAEGKVTIQQAKLGRVDIMATNGTIHVIDRVLLPPSISIETFKTDTEEP